MKAKIKIPGITDIYLQQLSNSLEAGNPLRSPILFKTPEELKSKGENFYLVNTKEEAGKIQKEKGLFACTWPELKDICQHQDIDTIIEPMPCIRCDTLTYLNNNGQALCATCQKIEDPEHNLTDWTEFLNACNSVYILNRAHEVIHQFEPNPEVIKKLDLIYTERHTALCT